MNLTPRQEAAFTGYVIALERVTHLKQVRVITGDEARERWARLSEAQQKFRDAQEELDASVIDEIVWAPASLVSNGTPREGNGQ